MGNFRADGIEDFRVAQGRHKQTQHARVTGTLLLEKRTRPGTPIDQTLALQFAKRSRHRRARYAEALNQFRFTGQLAAVVEFAGADFRTQPAENVAVLRTTQIRLAQWSPSFGLQCHSKRHFTASRPFNKANFWRSALVVH